MASAQPRGPKAARSNAQTLVDIQRAARLRAVADLLKQVSDPTRLRILQTLVEGERNVGQLCEDMEVQSQPALSHHLNLLKLSDLVRPDRRGKTNVYRATDKGRTLVAAVGPLMM